MDKTNHDKLMKKVKTLQKEIDELNDQLKHKPLSPQERAAKRILIEQLRDMIEVHMKELPGLK